MKRYLIIVLLLLVAPIVVKGQAWSGILAPSRAVDWSGDGVPGGIPSASWTQCGTTIAPFGSPGSFLAPTTINNAIAACGPNTFVLLGNGSFYLNSGIVMKSSVAVRGGGPDNTKIFFSGQNGCGGLFAVVCFMGMNIGYNSSFAQPGQSNSATWAGTNGTNGVYTAGATSIRLTGVGSAGILNGDYIYLDQADDPAVANGFLIGTINTISPPFSLEQGAPGRNGNTRSQAQIVKVVSGCPSPTGCTGAGPFDITIPAPGIYGLNWRSSQTPGAYFPNAGNTLKNAGIEGVSIDQSATPIDTGPAGIAFFNASENWVYNVRSIKAHRNHVVFWQAAHNTVLSSYIYDSQNAATQSYGIEFFIASANLVANTVFQHSTTPIVLGPATGNAIVYNFGIDNFILQGTLTVTQTSMSGCPGACVATYTYTGYTPAQGGFGTGAPISMKGLTNGGGEFNGDNLKTLNVTATTFQVAFASGTNVGNAAESATGLVSNGTLFPTTALHDAGVNYNLYEGNIGSLMYGDVFHGTSNAQTFFRNYFVGYEKNKNTSSAFAINDLSYHRYHNFIGNVLGEAGITTGYENYPTCVGCTGEPVYQLGFGNSNGTVTVVNDTQVRQTSMRWGNYDVATSGIRWNATEVPSTLTDGYANPVPATHNLPASFIFSSQPSWYLSPYSPITQYPAIGPDKTGGTAIAADMLGTVIPSGLGYATPAELCYLNAPIDPAYPTGLDRGVLLFNATTCYTGSGSVPFAPTGLTATSSSSNVILNWTAPITPPSFSSYNVYRGTVHNGPYSLISSGVTSPTFTDVPPSGTFFYVVTAVNGSGESAKSNEATATFPPPVTISILPASLTYASRTVGTTSPSQTITFTNTSGAGVNVTISSISITGANAGDYAQTNNCPGTLASGSSCGIFPTFTPTAVGTRIASVTVVDNAAGSPHTVSLSGTGVSGAPVATITPSSHDFGSYLVGSTSPTFDFTLSNTGTGNLNITSIGFASGAASGQITPNCGAADDGLTHMPTDWGTRGKPGGGEGDSYQDPLAQIINGAATPCRVWEVTDSTSDLLSGAGPSHAPTTIEYSPMGSLFNVDNSYVILYQSGATGKHQYIKDVSNVTKASGTPPATTTFPIKIDPAHMPADMNTSDGVFWDRANPNLFYYFASNQLKSATIIGTNSVSTAVLATFSAYVEVGPMNYPGHAYDGTTINLVGRPATGFFHVFAYNLATSTTGDDITSNCTVSGFPFIGVQPGGDCLHKLQMSADGHLMIDYSNSATPGQFLSNGTSLKTVWAGNKTAHHIGGKLQDGTSIWLSVNDPSTTNNGGSQPNSNNPCYLNLGQVYMKISDILASTAPPISESCFFSDYFAQTSHMSWQGGSNQPWVAVSQTTGGAANSTCEFYFNSNGSYCAPTNACVFGNNNCGAGSWTTYMGELDLIPNDCTGATTVTQGPGGNGAGCNSGPSGRKATRLAYLYGRALENFWDQSQANISADGRFIMISQTLGYNATGCPGTIDSTQFGAGGCPDAYLIGPLFNNSSGSSGNGINFKQVNNCPSVLPAGQNCAISVSFAPTAAGSLSDTLQVTDNAAGSPQTASVSGIGINTKCQLTNLFILSGQASMCQ